MCEMEKINKYSTGFDVKLGKKFGKTFFFTTC